MKAIADAEMLADYLGSSTAEVRRLTRQGIAVGLGNGFDVRAKVLLYIEHLRRQITERRQQDA